MSEKDWKTLLGEAMTFIGYAACHGNKCRLPHCHSCYGDDQTGQDALEDFEARATEALK